MIGMRIRQARRAAGLSLDEAAKRLSVNGVSITRQGLSNYEIGRRHPGPGMLIHLAKILHVKPSYLLEESTVRITWTAYRSRTSLGKRERNRIESRAQHYVESFIGVQDKVNPGQGARFPKPLRVASLQDAELAAEKLRQEWRLGEAPIDSVMHTVEDHGVIVITHPMEGVRFDGLSGFANELHPVIVVNSSVPDDRFRLDLAHELGHLVMDCSKLDEKTEEKLANRFAAAFLVPRNVAENELGKRRSHLSLRELSLLKDKYGISMQAWVRRGKDVGIIAESAYRQACINFSQKGWRKQEPYTYHGNEKPEKLRQYLLRALAESLITPDLAERILPGCTNEVIEAKDDKTMTTIEFMKLSAEERRQALEVAAKEAAEDYMTNPELTAFDVCSEDGLNE